MVEGVKRIVIEQKDQELARIRPPFDFKDLLQRFGAKRKVLFAETQGNKQIVIKNQSDYLRWIAKCGRTGLSISLSKQYLRNIKVKKLNYFRKLLELPAKRPRNSDSKNTVKNPKQRITTPTVDATPQKPRKVQKTPHRTNPPLKSLNQVYSNEGSGIVSVPKTGKLIHYDFQEETTVTNKDIQMSSRVLQLNSNTVLVTGGLQNPSQAFTLDLSTLKTQEMPQLNTPRYWHSVCLFNGNPLVLGGKFESFETSLTSVETLGEKGWTEMPPLLTGRCNPSTVSVNSCIYAFGGVLYTPSYRLLLNSVERFNGAVWETLKFKTQIPIQGMGVVPLGKQQVICLGGKKSSNQMVKEVWKLNLETGDREDLKPLNKPVRFTYNSFVLQNNKVSGYGNEGQFISYDIN